MDLARFEIVPDTRVSQHILKMTVLSIVGTLQFVCDTETETNYLYFKFKYQLASSWLKSVKNAYQDKWNVGFYTSDP